MKRAHSPAQLEPRRDDSNLPMKALSSRRNWGYFTNTQVALLRVLQEGSFERVGGQETISVKVRVICATHRNLEQMVKEGTFRADLYYRLRGVILELPALRDRPTDIPLLVAHFLKKQTDGPGKARHFDQDALASLFQHDWPGNIRELENVVRSVSLFADGATVTMSDLRELGDILPPPSEAAVLALSEALETVDMEPGEVLMPPVSNAAEQTNNSGGSTPPPGGPPPLYGHRRRPDGRRPLRLDTKKHPSSRRARRIEKTNRIRGDRRCIKNGKR